ncbi:MAG: glycosyltransferase [Gammaproteobacteria bacterium]|nr:MAG: glycosyltransferase [Gammaproteobacteria bacterium]TDJ32473.1 MAG: glycosyltransferase [Gammaproteobacteria bacterium]
MAESGEGIIVQLCPNDHPPFLDICKVYQAAGESLGYQVLTIFLSPPAATPWGSSHYLNATDLRQTRTLSEKLEKTVRGCVGEEVPLLTLCHRYRAFRMFCATSLKSKRTVAVAHEFGFFKRVRRRLALKLLSREVIFAGVSEPVRAELAHVVKEPLLFPNGFDWARATKRRVARVDAYAALSVPGEGFTFGVVGRLHHKKQPGLAVAGFREAVADMPGARLVFIGDGELHEVIKSESAGLPIHFAGFITDAPHYYAALDVLLIPSGDKEAFAMVALEAMAAGVPVVAGPAPGPRSVLGEIGNYFEEATAKSVAVALREVFAAEQSGLLESRKKQGIEHIKRNYSIAATARRLDAIIQPAATEVRVTQ